MKKDLQNNEALLIRNVAKNEANKLEVVVDIVGIVAGLNKLLEEKIASFTTASNNPKDNEK